MVLHFFLGTAAELIKLHPLITRARGRGWTVHLVATGQSSTNLENQMRDFGLDPAELRWLVPRATDLATAWQAARWFWAASRARKSFVGDYALVHGDTLSTLAGARVSHRAGLRVVHVEAGLRSGRWLNPFPEEIVRRLVSRSADVHCAPDDSAAEALRAAGVRGGIFSTGGNTLLDTLRDQAVGGVRERHVLVNVHRFENLNSRARWSRLVDTTVTAARDRPVTLVAHPPTRHRLSQDPAAENRLRQAGVKIVDRVTFSTFIRWLNAADFLITDGGSNQEECSYLGVPCLILREETERREGLGANGVLSRFDPEVIADFLREPERHRRPPAFPRLEPSNLILDQLAARA